MDFHGAMLDSLRAKGFKVGSPYIQAGASPGSGHLCVVINEIAVPIELARDLDAGRLRLEDLASA